MQVISLKDYAEQKNVSYEAVRQQVVRYKDELAGHVIRDGRQQFLDEDAVVFLDAKRTRNPVTIIQMDKDERIEELEAQVKALLTKTADQADRISALAEWKAENAMLIAGAEQSRLALQAAQEEKDTLQRDYNQAVETLEQMRKEASMRLMQAEEAEERKLQAQHLAESEKVAREAAETAREAAEAEAQALRAELERPLSFRERWFGRRKAQ